MNLTPEDLAILAARGATGGMSLEIGDDIDYRALLAREVYSERGWRIDSIRETPESMTAFDTALRNAGTSLREHVERINGESL
jgi:hypothetical protein